MKKSSSEEFKKRIRELEKEVARRRKAEDTLKKETILFNSPYSIVIFDADGHYVVGNKAFFDLFGSTPPPDYSIFNDPIIKKAGFQEQILKLKKGEIIKTPVEFWYNPHDVKPDLPDKNVCTKGVAFPVMDNNGTVESIIIMHEDITERKLAEDALKQKIIELNTFINNIPDMAWLKGADSRFIVANKAFGEVAGIDPESLANHPCEFFFGKEAAKKFREDDLKVMKGGKQVIIEEKIKDLKNNDIWLETIKSPIFNESGETVGTVGIARNITKRKQAEKALQESEEKYRDLVENINDVIYIRDGNGIVTYISPSVESLCGYSPSEVIGRSFSEFIYHEDLTKVIDQFKKISGSIYQGECRIITKTGKIRCILFSSLPKFSDGQLISVQGVLTDITERKQIEKELMAAQKELEIKTRNLEDINTALNVLLKHQDEKKHEMETSIISSLNNLILPYIEKLKSCTTDDRHKTYINIIETNLLEITKPFINQMRGLYAKLTPTEIQIAGLIKENKTTKDIADILYISETTVFFHRRNIRNKLGIKNKKSNLRSYLQSFQSK